MIRSHDGHPTLLNRIITILRDIRDRVTSPVVIPHFFSLFCPVGGACACCLLSIVVKTSKMLIGQRDSVIDLIRFGGTTRGHPSVPPNECC